MGTKAALPPIVPAPVKALPPPKAALLPEFFLRCFTRPAAPIAAVYDYSYNLYIYIGFRGGCGRGRLAQKPPSRQKAVLAKRRTPATSSSVAVSLVLPLQSPQYTIIPIIFIFILIFGVGAGGGFWHKSRPPANSPCSRQSLALAKSRAPANSPCSRQSLVPAKSRAPANNSCPLQKARAGVLIVLHFVQQRLLVQHGNTERLRF